MSTYDVIIINNFMAEIQGYKIKETIYESASSLIYRALNENDNTPVVIKQCNNKYPTAEEISKFDHEYNLICRFEDDGIIHAYQMLKADNSPAIVLEDIGGQPLADILKSKKLRMDEFLNLGVRISEIIGNIHKHNIIHKDINPSNIIWNIEKDIVRIIDFGISTELPREITSVKNPKALEGTLAYISPEQTGRMNRSMDYRTDFYSLGITFYRMLTGRLPFESKNLLEVIHSHIAIMPVSPHETDKSIPEAVSEIVMKLMAKNAEDRYQSAYGLNADLERCLQELRDTGAISAFAPGQQDVSDKFQIPQKLYGREQETGTLMSAFERVREGDTELMLVSGFSGIGKSVLINELQKPIVRHSGYFISGKFERLKKDVPYSAFFQAFTGLARQILAENEDEIAVWKEKILSALGPNGKLVTDMSPMFELIIGKQPEVPALGHVESQNRFNLVFQNTIKVLASREHPLVVFLDDLQWADSGSLHLLKLSTSDSDIKHLFIIGAYLHNETPDSHPLILTLDEIKKTGAAVNNIFLQPLNAEHVGQLLGDTLNRATEETRSLAELLIRKTRGNPFFINEFLKSLYKESLIEFSFEHGWLYDMAGIEETQATDNVVELMAEKITGLPENSQEILKTGACIGSYFNVTTLATICEKPEEDILTALNEVLQKGMLNRIDNIYRFSHDRIYEAAYSLISDEEKTRQHYRIGNLELKNTDKEKLQEKIFYIVNQLNAGLALVTEESEKRNLAGLNLMAGKKAIASNAYASALNYLNAGIGLLEEDCWKENYDFTLALYQEATIAAELSADYEMMEKLAGEVLQNAKTILDKIKVYEATIFASMAQNQLLEAIRTGLHVLRQLGVKMPEKPGKLRILYELLFVKLSLMGKSVENLINLPEMKDPTKLVILQILSGIATPTYTTSPELVPLINFNGVRSSVKYGNSIYSPYFYAIFGLIHCGILRDINTGYEWGKLARNLVEKYNIKEIKSKVLTTIWGFINHWKRPLRDAINPLLEAYKTGIETGDLEFAALSAYGFCLTILFSGVELAEVDKEMAKYAEMIKKINQDTFLNYLLQQHQTVLNLRGMSPDPCKLTGSSYDESKMMPIHKKTNDKTALCTVYVSLLSLNFIFDNKKEALRYAELVKLYIESVVSTPHEPVFYFYDSLIRLALYPTEKKSIQRKYLKIVNRNQKKMKKWALHAPMSYKHKYHLVEAEIARVKGQELKARKRYELAVKLAHENKFQNEEALSLELTAKFWLGLDEERIASLYMTEAHSAYRMWGAIAKVKHIEEKYRHLIKIHSVRTDSSSTLSTSSSASSSEAIDLSTIIRISQTLSGEIDLGRLLEAIMISSIENAGAQRGFLIIENEKNKNLYIEAEGTADKEIKVLESVPVEGNTSLSSKIVLYVNRTGEDVVLNNAQEEGAFRDDPYIKNNKIKSLLCTPITHKGKTAGILYLENNLTANSFTDERLELLRILSSQAAISIENARLYENLEEKVAERTAQLEEANAKLKELSLIDPLTLLRNRRYIYEFVSQLSENFIKTQARILSNTEKRDLNLKGKVYAVYLIDIDYFKEVNDTYGHQAGDDVLIKISGALKKMIRAEDILVRWGGEEFLIILVNTKPEYKKIFSKKILDSFQKTPLIIDNKTIYKTCSIGSVHIPLSKNHPELLTLEHTINICDFALYIAKENGRNRAVHIELKNDDTNDRINQYLLNLSKNTEINNDYIDIQYVI